MRALAPEVLTSTFSATSKAEPLQSTTRIRFFPQPVKSCPPARPITYSTNLRDKRLDTCKWLSLRFPLQVFQFLHRPARGFRNDWIFMVDEFCQGWNETRVCAISHCNQGIPPQTAKLGSFNG